MKRFQILFILVFGLLSFTASAQYGGYNNGYGNGYGGGYGRGGGMGMDRSMMAGPQQSTPSKPKETPPEEIAAIIMDQMKPQVNLDELQTIAISNVLAESIREQGILLKNESSSQDQKIEQIKALKESTDKKISAFLNPDQIEKYKTFMDNFKDMKKSKSKSKKKKDKDSKEDAEQVKDAPDTKISE